MIYQQESLIINSNIENCWNILKKIMTSPSHPEIFYGARSIDIVDETEGKIIRILRFEDRSEEEVVTVNFSSNKITCLVQNNPNYFAEYTYSLVNPSDPFLSEKNTSLIVISAWRMLPGVFAAPTIDRQDYISQTAKNIKAEMEK